MLDHEPMCGRPDCDQPGHSSHVNEFFVEKIVGRRENPASGGFSWLVKWDHYPISQATWEVGGDIGGSEKLVEQFRLEALEEGWDVDQNPSLLLGEAIDGGWFLDY
ncbi:hypothetical protein JAAARDRAFT_679125 [Jaapia argillacea MUCL 33604]|uniref:Chromo domain-containing protein n=1 Tax=Jaapia argillacea MUCL 33604 TaxID=933084 RepID=A0A067Q5G5_9AGAM|nr:hypothetical protein JAAARDRAFT_679125 [Jaapia argillacea MUCL 33604]